MFAAEFKRFIQICVLALLVDATSAQNITNCVTREDRYVTCTYRGARGVFKVPANATNMRLEIYGASGGGALDHNEDVNPATRGLGVHFEGRIAKETPPNTLFLIMPPVNGADATHTKSGTMKKRCWGDDPGQGGEVGLSLYRRYAGAGGTAGCLVSPDFRAFLCLSGAGGAGAYAPTGFSKGGNAGFLPVEGYGSKIIGLGEHGLPADMGGERAAGSRSGSGGSPKGLNGRRGKAGLLDFYSGGDGAACGDVLGRDYCYPGGGGGAGIRGGGGGGSYSHPLYFDNASAGGGASGSSALIQDNSTFYGFTQEHMYSPDPRVIITYEIKSRCRTDNLSCSIM